MSMQAVGMIWIAGRIFDKFFFHVQFYSSGFVSAGTTPHSTCSKGQSRDLN